MILKLTKENYMVNKNYVSNNNYQKRKTCSVQG